MQYMMNLRELDKMAQLIKRPPLEVRYDLQDSSAVQYRAPNPTCETITPLSRRWMARSLHLSPFSVAVTEAEDKIDEAAFRIFQHGKRTEDGGILGCLS